MKAGGNSGVNDDDDNDATLTFVFVPCGEFVDFWPAYRDSYNNLVRAHPAGGRSPVIPAPRRPVTPHEHPSILVARSIVIEYLRNRSKQIVCVIFDCG